MDSTRRSEYWEVKSEKISPQNIFPLVDTFPPNAMPFSFIMQREYFPQAVIAASVPIDHNGCKITSQNHFIARDHNFTCSTYNSQNQMIEQNKKIQLPSFQETLSLEKQSNQCPASIRTSFQRRWCSI